MPCLNPKAEPTATIYNSAGPGVAAKTKTAKAKVTISRETPELKLSFIQSGIMSQNIIGVIAGDHFNQPYRVTDRV